MAERRERVVLELVDNFSTGMAKAAAATALLNRELKSLDGKTVETSRDNDRLSRSLGDVGTQATKAGSQFERGGKEIDKYSGRLGLLVDAAVTLGPALIPIGAAAIPAITGLAAGLGAAAGAAGVALLAFQGLGDGLKAIDAYQLAPTTENLQKMRVAMADLGPAGADFARFLNGLEPQLHALQDTARSGLFPGLQAGIEELLPLLPQVQRIIAGISTEMGNLATDAGGALAGPKFTAFFDYLENDASTILHHFAEATGNVFEGLANLTVAFGPVSMGFSAGLESMTQSFADWTAGLSKTQGFQDFVNYIRESGPQALDLLGSLGTALVGILRAMAPWGGVVLPTLTAFADVLTVIANSPIGAPLFTAAAGFIALNRAVSVLRPALSGISSAFVDLQNSPNRAATALARFGGAARVAAGAGGMALLVTGLSNTNESLGAFESAAGGALAGFSVGGPWGAAIGGAVGALGSLASANENTSAFVGDLTASLDAQTGALTANSQGVAAKALEDSGALKMAQDLGLNLSTVTDAALGNKDAMAALTDQLSKYANVTDPSTGQVDQELYRQRLEADKLVGTLDDLSSASDSTLAAQKRIGAAAGGASAAFARQSKVLTAARAAADETAQSFLAFGDSLNDNKVSLDDWIAEQQKVADALQNFANNAATAARKGLDPGFIEKLRAAGADGALRLKQLASGSEESIARINRAFRSGEKSTTALGDVLASLKGPVLNVDDTKMRAKLKSAMAALQQYDLTKAQAGLLIQDLASGKVKSAQQLVDKYGLTKATATALLNDLASGKLQAVKSLLDSVDGRNATSTVTINTVHNDSYNSKRSGIPGYASGGYTGQGGKFEPAGVVHRNEVVLPEEIVYRDRAHLQSRYGFLPGMSSLPGYADGGLVGSRSTAPPQLTTSRAATTGGGQTVRHVIDVRVSGEMDLNRAVAQIRQVASDVSRVEINADKKFERVMAGD